MNQLWLQNEVYNGELASNKVGTKKNIAYALAKAVSAEVLGYHVESSGAETRRDRHRLAPEVAENSYEEGTTVDSSEQERWLESVVAADGDIGE